MQRQEECVNQGVTEASYLKTLFANMLERAFEYDFNQGQLPIADKVPQGHSHVEQDTGCDTSDGNKATWFRVAGPLPFPCCWEVLPPPSAAFALSFSSMNELGSRRSPVLLQFMALTVHGTRGMYQALDSGVQEENERLFLPQAVCALEGEVRRVV